MALSERARYGLDPETMQAVREEVRRELEREERERSQPSVAGILG